MHKTLLCYVYKITFIILKFYLLYCVLIVTNPMFAELLLFFFLYVYIFIKYVVRILFIAVMLKKK